MCGIIGVLSTEKMDHQLWRQTYMRQALITGVLRGENSTGIMFVDHDNRIGYWKHTFAGPDFVQHKVVDKILDRARDFKAFIGHHRFRTSGNISRKDAHPHEHKHITLVHNGGIVNSYQLTGHKAENGDPDVDTFRLTKAMAETGSLEILKEVEGSYALVWWDAKENALFMAKNNDRPLAIQWTKDHKTLLIASEWEMLNWLTRRNNMEVEQKCIKLKENILYRFDINKEIVQTKTEYQEKKKEIKIYANRHGYDTRHDPYFDEEGVDWNQWPHQRADQLPRRSDINSVPFLDRSRPMSHLPAVRKDIERVADEEAKKLWPHLKDLGGAKIGPVPSLNEKKMRKINAALKERKLTYGAQVWARPEEFYKYKNSHFGIGEYGYLPDNSGIAVHNLSELGWQKAMEGNILVPITIVDVQNSNQKLVGNICWHRIAQSWDFVVAGIDQESPYAFIPAGLGRFLTKKQFYKMTDSGCSMCKEAIALREAPFLNWIDDIPVCQECSKPIPVPVRQEKLENAGVVIGD